MVTLKSDKADFAGQGVEIEPGTFIHDIGDESGVPHHYFNEAEVRDLFTGWEFMVLAEQVITHLARPDGFWSIRHSHSRIGGLWLRNQPSKFEKWLTMGPVGFRRWQLFSPSICIANVGS